MCIRRLNSTSPAGRAVAIALLLPLLVSAQRFYPDDPLTEMPPPVRVEDAREIELNDWVDFFHNTLGKPGERNTSGGIIESQAVNTLGDVPDDPGWFQNRHARRRMTVAELVRGPGDRHPPADGVWTVVAAKVEGVTPGFTIEDRQGRRYLLKFDPVSNPELASGAEVVTTKFFHALGYNVPENYVVYFERDRIQVGTATEITEIGGKLRKMDDTDVDRILRSVPRDSSKGFRALASLYLPGKPLGPFQYRGVRTDDPNDIVRHEHRRDLRGLFVFAAWLGHNDVKALNSLDTLVEENGLRYIKHHLIDFGASLGSDSFTAKSPRAGNEYLFAWKPAAWKLFGLGLYVPGWAHAHYPDIPAAGNFEYKLFEPEAWKPNYPIPAFENRLPDDTFWAAKHVMAFTDEEIRALVATGQYSDPEAEAWLTECLIERRDKIGRTYFRRVLPLDRFRIEKNTLAFEDLEVRYGFLDARDYTVRWSRFDNDAEVHTALDGASGFALPEQVHAAPAGAYFAATISADDDGRKTVTVYLHKSENAYEIVGIDRTW